MQRIQIRTTPPEWLLHILFFMMLFQDALAIPFPILQYTDECLALIGPAALTLYFFRTGKITLEKQTLRLTLLIILFVVAGAFGNVRYNYQKTSAVLIDLFTNLKFFFCILTGFVVFNYVGSNTCKRVLLSDAKLASVLLAILTVIDLVFHVFPSQGERYGIRIVQLFYSHATYLAGASTFLIAILTLFYEKKNRFHIMLSLLVCFCTVRGKAWATVAVYCLMCLLILRAGRKLRVWHVVAMAAMAFFIAGEQFSYYYIELQGTSARSALTRVSVELAMDYFPFGTGFGTFGSAEAAENYSQIYYMYGLSTVHGLSPNSITFGSDTFWPIVIGQTGVLGTICYVTVLWIIFSKILKLHYKDIYAYATGIFMFAYFAISSTSEPTFCNVIAMPLAVLVGIILAYSKEESVIW